MEPVFVKLKTSRSIIYLVFFIVLLGVSIYYTILDMKVASYWIMMYIFSIAVSIYHMIIYIGDIFSKKSGLTIEEDGLRFNFEHLKNLIVPWKSISRIQVKKNLIAVFVYNPDIFLDRINKVSAIIIKGSLKRVGTFLLIHSKQFHMEQEKLEETIKSAYEKYSKIDDDVDE